MPVHRKRKVTVPGKGLLAKAAKGAGNRRQKIAAAAKKAGVGKKKAAKKPVAVGNTTTARNPPGLQKSKKQGAKELKALRDKQAARRRARSKKNAK